MSDTPSFRYLSSFEPREVREALGAWSALPPGGAVLALVPEARAAGVAPLQEACRELGLSLGGGVFPRLIRDGRFVDEGAWLLHLAVAPPMGLLDELGDDPTEAARRLAEAIAPALSERQPADTLFLLFDATTPNLASRLDALYLELGAAVRYSGVSAGSETFQPTPCLFDDARLLGGGALWALLPSSRKTVLLHDYAAPLGSSLATSAAGNRVTSIDFRPAFDFYRARMLAQYGVELTPESFYRYAVEYPFGIALANGQLLVRMPVALEPDGSIRCAGEVPENAVLVVVHAPDPRSGETARALAARLAEAHIARDVVLFYCAGRRLRLGAASDDDLRGLLEAAGGRVVGALSLGEVGSIQDGAYPLFHNGAFVCVGLEPA